MYFVLTIHLLELSVTFLLILSTVFSAYYSFT